MTINLKSAAVFICACLTITACSKSDNASTKINAIPEKPEAIIDNTFDPTGKPLSFKGIYLGMTVDELKKKSIKKEVPWKYYEFKDSGKKGFSTSLSEKDRWIGYEGEETDRKYYGIRAEAIDWFEGRIVRITIVSTAVTADYINTTLKQWMSFSVNGLENKYGKPTKILIPVDSLSIFHFKSREGITCYEWDRLRESIEVAILEQSFHYSCYISFIDKKGLENKYKAETGNPKTSF